jgi:hypothetical protein
MTATARSTEQHARDDERRRRMDLERRHRYLTQIRPKLIDERYLARLNSFSAERAA